MKTRVKGKRSPVTFNMTPMIDVVFLLIIFFLVSSHLARQENRLELPLPSAASGQPPEQDPAPRLTINVLKEGRLLIAGSQIAPGQLAPRLASELARQSRELQVRIRSDRGVSYRFVEPILLACAQSGIWNVSFAVTPKEDPDG